MQLFTEKYSKGVFTEKIQGEVICDKHNFFLPTVKGKVSQLWPNNLNHF